MKILFASTFGADTVPEAEDNEDSLPMSEKDAKFTRILVEGVKENDKRLSEVISEFSQGWAIDRIGKVEICILKIAAYELLFLPDVPVGASVNEAVELSKNYCDDKSPSFINGILGSIGRKYRT